VQTDVTDSAQVDWRAIRFTIAKRAGVPEDLEPIAVWVAGTGVGDVTGQIFAVDGGLTQRL
jgi:NAD(P)-dependent dehydrogenase (short-subunit alcohol dehydrogenase family)